MRIAATTLLLALCLAQHTDAQSNTYSGLAARYRKGLMARVADNRGIPRQECMIAATYEKIGTWVSIKGVNTGKTLHCLVIDIPKHQDRQHIKKRGIIIELAHENALDICGSTKTPPHMCPVNVIK